MALEKSKIVIIASDKQRKIHKKFIKDVLIEFDVVEWKGSFEECVTYLILGGDGSLNYFINKFDADDRESKNVIYFATGTANDFARSIKLEISAPSIKKMKSILSYNKKISVPTMKCNDVRFINVASAGAPAKVTNSGSNLLKKAVGKMSYYINGIEEALSSDKYILGIYNSNLKKEEKIETRGFVIAQGLFAGGGIRISQNYCPHFGEKFSFNAVSSVDLINNLSAVIELQKDEPNLANLNFISGTYKELCIKSKKVVPIKLDGEEYSSKNLIFKKDILNINFFLH